MGLGDVKMLGDLHIHMILDGIYYRSAIDSHREDPVDQLICERLQDYARREITFLRDGGDAWGVSLRARELAPGYGIDYLSPAFPIYKKGHYGAFIGKGFSDFSEYLQLLKEAERNRADFIKLMISGLIDFSQPDSLTEPGLERQEIRDMVCAAHDRGFAVMVHANGDRSVQAALEVGVESVEHGAFLGEETLCAMAEGDCLWVPTLSTIGNLVGCGRYPDGVLKPLLLQQQENIAFAAGKGGLIGLGSDAGAYKVPHSLGAETEYAHLKEALKEKTDAILAAGECFAKAKFQK